MIFGHVLKKHISMNPVISGLLLLGVVICVYCISIMLGLAVGQYQFFAKFSIAVLVTSSFTSA